MCQILGRFDNPDWGGASSMVGSKRLFTRLGNWHHQRWPMLTWELLVDSSSSVVNCDWIEVLLRSKDVPVDKQWFAKILDQLAHDLSFATQRRWIALLTALRAWICWRAAFIRARASHRTPQILKALIPWIMKAHILGQFTLAAHQGHLQICFCFSVAGVLLRLPLIVAQDYALIVLYRTCFELVQNVRVLVVSTKVAY